MRWNNGDGHDPEIFIGRSDDLASEPSEFSGELPGLHQMAATPRLIMTGGSSNRMANALEATIQILVADDQPLSQLGLKALFSSDFGFNDVTVVNGNQELLVALQRNPQVSLVTVSLGLPGMHGSTGIRQLRAQFPNIRLVVISDTMERMVVLDALTAGAHGFIVKTMSGAQMAAALGAVISGQIYVPSMLAEMTREASLPLASVHEEHPHQELTHRQQEVLKLMAVGKANKEIARSLAIAESTVKVHLNAAFRVLGVHNRVSAVAALREFETTMEIREPCIPGLTGAGRRSTDLPHNSSSKTAH